MTTTCRLDRTVVTSFHPRPRNERRMGDSIVALLDSGKDDTTFLVCALTNGSIKVYDKSTLQLISNMQGPDHLTCASRSSLVVVAASGNGSIAAFDLRVQQRQDANPNGVLHHRLVNPGTISSMDGCAETIALGGSLGIHLWDWRQQRTSRLLDTTHQNVTQVKFVHRHQVMSAGDALLCVLDVKTQEIPLCMMYLGKSTGDVQKLGFCGDMVYCISSENSLSLWDLSKGQCVQRTGIHQLRQSVRSSTVLNLMVDCCYQNDTLSVLASNHSGDAHIFQWRNSAWQSTQKLVGGHRGAVTAWAGNYTGGTDARICKWTTEAATMAYDVHESSSYNNKRQRCDVE